MNVVVEQPTAEQDLQVLPQMITAWKQVQEESSKLKEQLRERKVRQKALEEVILRTMKKHNIGALDLKQSNGRLLYKKRNAKGALTQKSLQEILAEHLKSEDAANKAVAFITEKRGTRLTETLAFEKL
jgi:hypothetical protein